MTAFLERISHLSQKQLMLLALELKERLDKAQQGEPIAIVGMACRYPGAGTPEAYWQLLDEGRDATRDAPRDRWDMDAFYDPDPDAPGCIAARRGGYLDDIAGFDEKLFGISPREALSMDPQQRLLLETAWEALERAGLATDRLAGVPAGVFVGLCNSDHFLRLVGRGPETLDAYVASGNAPSIAAGRIAYCLGLNGPALTVDTACSSSLVAIHLAVRSLRAGETRVALAGGVNVMCAPEIAIALSRGRMLAPDGRCKTFDAAADGFARGEGCGMLVLKRLDAARADGDPVLALICGTAINQDGRSGGLTVPSGPAQQAVIGAALADAGLCPADISYVEAHGTGTSLGDPIELRALAGAYGRDRAAPLLVGSAKTNLGHLESAAGVAGVMKTVLALRAGRLPRSLHFSTPNPHVPWDEIPVEVIAEARPWPHGQAPRRAGVSSFGFSGTNAHLIVEEAPPEPPRAEAGVDRPLHVLALSARSAPALSALASAYAEAVRGAHESVADLAHTAGAGRNHHVTRAAIIAADHTTAAEALDALARGAPHRVLRRGEAEPGRSDVVFMFSGQGGQHPGMARALYERAPTFRSEIDRCNDILGADGEGRFLRDILFAPEGDGAIHATAWTQPAMLALQHALSSLWASWGVRPAAVIGHSLGEFAAAVAAGVFSLEDGLRLVKARGALCSSLPEGAMAAIHAPLADVEAIVARLHGKLSVAAINGPDSIVVSGAREAVGEVCARLEARGFRSQAIKISMPAHSPLVDAALDAMERVAANAVARQPRIPVAWNVTGGAPVHGGAPDARYWRRHLREPVRFADGLAALEKQGFRTFLEIGPHPTITALALDLLPATTTVVSSLRRGGDDWEEMLGAAAALYVEGASIDWAGFDAPYSRRKVSAPTYPFEHRHYWIDGPNRTIAVAGAERGLAGARLDAPGVQRTVRITQRAHPYLGDHVVGGRVIAPGPLLLEIAQACAAAERGKTHGAVEAFVMHAPLVVEADGAVAHLTLAEDAFEVHARGAEGAWIRCAEGRFAEAGIERPALDVETLKSRLAASVDVGAHYQALKESGVSFGPAFRCIGRAWRTDREALAEIECRAPLAHFIHPPALDAALQVIGLAAGGGDLRLLTGIDRAWLHRTPPVHFLAHALLRKVADDMRADVALYDKSGAFIGALDGVSLRRPSADTLGGLCYAVKWIEAPAPGALAPNAECVAAARTALAGHSRDMTHHDALGPELDRLALLHAAEGLRQLGFNATPGETVDVEAAADCLGVVPRHRRTFARLFNMLSDAGVFCRTERGFVTKAPLPKDAPDPHYAALIPRFDPASGELRLLRRCGGALATVLRGEIDPAALLFPDGSFDDARRLYDDAPAAKAYSTALAAAVSAAAPRGARLRVIEIGAGTGATTAHILGALPAATVEYTFTDVSPLFLERAAERFKGHDSLRYMLLDIERDPVAQGFTAGRYDIVVAANVLHATRDLRATVRHARRLLAPGGMLALIEGVADEAWIELTFGLTEGWRRHDDAPLRVSSPLIDRAAWERLLAEEGLLQVEICPSEQGALRAIRQQALILARAPAPAARWRIVSGQDDAVADAARAALAARGDAIRASNDGGAHLIFFARPRQDAAAATREAISALADFAAAPGGRAFIVTRGAQAVAGAQAPDARDQAPLWGVGRVFALEHPARWGGLFDLDADGDAQEQARRLVAAIGADDGEDQIAIRGAARYVARLVRAEEPARRAPPIRPDATYLVTGGFGGLGLRVATWLADQGAQYVALMGRRPPADDPTVRAIEARGVRVYRLRGDVAEDADWQRMLGELAAEGAPLLAGAFHAAATFEVAPIASVAADAIAAVLRPKIGGLCALERAAPNLPFVVLFSSTTALLGAAGFASYAAANAFFDASAESARGRVLSIRWGTWDEMRLASTQRQQQYGASGLLPMPSSDALELMGRAISGDERTAMFAAVDWSRLKPLHEARRARPMLSTIESGKADVVARPDGARLADKLHDMSAEEREQAVLAFVRDEVAAVLAAPADAPPAPDAGLFDLGIDSLMSVELKRRLERGVGRPLPSTLAFNYPSIRAISGYLLAVLAKESPLRPELAAPAAHLEELDDEEIAKRLRELIKEME